MRTSPMELDKLKSRAKSILARLKTLGFSAGLQQSYELLAAAEGHRNWATMKATLSDGTLLNSRTDLRNGGKEEVSLPEEYSDLVREMLMSDGNSFELTAKVYEALGYTIEWKMCQPDIHEALWDDTRRPRPFIVTRPELRTPILCLHDRIITQIRSVH